MFIPEIEKSSTSDIQEFQNTLLIKNLKYLSEKSIYYSNLFKKNNININKIKSTNDLINIPVTTKKDLQNNNNDFICCEKNKIIDYITTSGTLGDPVTFVLTDKDLERLAYNEYLSFTCAGGTSNDIYQLMTTIDRRFMAGIAYYLGVRKLGAGIIRVGNGIPELQWDTIKRVSPTNLIAVPSFILKIIEYAEYCNIDLKKTSIKSAICIGEPLRKIDFSYNTLSKKILEKWDLKLYSTYASTEMSTSFTECEHGIGGHHHPELIIVEFLDENDNPVLEGEPGEVTITSLGVEGMPLLRFKTGDVCIHYKAPCKCGRNTTRLGPVIGRKKQMIKYKGTTLYPPALYDVLDNIENIKNYIIEVYTNDIGTDEILIRIGTNNPEDKLLKTIKDKFRAKLRVAPEIRFESIEYINKIQYPESDRKATKFIDLRENK